MNAMYSNYINIGLILIVIITIGALIYTFRLAQEQRREEDSESSTKHPIIFNPVLLSYVFIGILMFIGAYFFYIYVFQ
ncbi:hypothetical protein [Chengkuizengella axinellae]|uniref:Short-chain dehydrogenase n=1 Tax=Chengkuizengella axinellae TaxID=3064388 RepID=A0ABT9IZX7_9BACL|nr:hypothetical protein [Chengkuizengella sp. 2205SS18-9]MDP5274697.1 hypothetical protein [Chengkuizengella sp. 2205SS18-9]